MDILSRIIELLGDKDQQELTKHLKLKKTAFTDWKSGKSKSYCKYLIEIADFFNVSIDYLVYGKTAVNDLSVDEIQLITDYRNLSEQGKNYILDTMDMVKEKYKKEQGLHQSLEQVG